MPSNLDFTSSDIHAAPTFVRLPKFERIEFLGFRDGVVQRFKAAREGQEFSLLALNIIRRDEKDFWEACQELLERAVQMAAARMHGVFRLELLNFNIHRELETFNFQDLTQLISNHGARLTPGQKRLIKYSTAYALLTKAVDEEWGKVHFIPGIEVFADEPNRLDKVVGRMWKIAESCPGPRLVVINDLSLTPIYDPSDEDQALRLRKKLPAQGDLFSTDCPEIYINDQRASTELVSKLSAT